MGRAPPGATLGGMVTGKGGVVPKLPPRTTLDGWTSEVPMPSVGAPEPPRDTPRNRPAWLTLAASYGPIVLVAGGLVAGLASRWLFPKAVTSEQAVSEEPAPANEQRELAKAA